MLLTVILPLAGAATANAEELIKAGTSQIRQVQIAFIGSGNLGGGTLNIGGGSYPFKIGGPASAESAFPE